MKEQMMITHAFAPASVWNACGRDERADAQRMGCRKAQLQKGEVVVVNGSPGFYNSPQWTHICDTEARETLRHKISWLPSQIDALYYTQNLLLVRLRKNAGAGPS
jgi:hypothetical protein